ncbi:hypothetical protein KV205_35280 [Streptomyces sp. SKN60]|uniref:hypothetical protein n=1 Tax=Streptomyces sp. SKN60 TaxID=2855506 RepID=UPI0022451B4F|nr:hypothetical protein [Streptomyces sp. SKN60]MCX2185729.1 hypothetical protein [Streptomyces sp. SKN60]
MNSTAALRPRNAVICPTIAGGAACAAEEAARSQLWWTAHLAAGGSGHVSVHVDTLRRWSGVLIDALLAFHDNMTHLPGPEARFWQRHLVTSTEERLQPVTSGLLIRRWLVHARHRTQSRIYPRHDKQLYQSWVPHLVVAVRDLIGDIAAIVAHMIHTGQDPATIAHLRQARHILQHACCHLNRPNTLRATSNEGQ